MLLHASKLPQHMSPCKGRLARYDNIHACVCVGPHGKGVRLVVVCCLLAMLLPLLLPLCLVSWTSMRLQECCLDSCFGVLGHHAAAGMLPGQLMLCVLTTSGCRNVAQRVACNVHGPATCCCLRSICRMLHACAERSYGVVCVHARSFLHMFPATVRLPTGLQPHMHPAPALQDR